MSYHRYGHYGDNGKKRRRSPLVILFACIALLGVLGVAVFSTCEKVAAPDRATLTVGINTPFPPFEIRKGENIVGFDVDLVEHVAKALGRKLIVKDLSEFDALLPALETGTLDMVVSAVTIRGDRDEVVDFSEPYFNASQAILVRKGNAFSYSGNPADFAGVRIGYQEGTTSQFWVQENLLNKVNIGGVTPFGDIAFGLQLLRLEVIDAIIIDAPVAVSFVKTQSDLSLGGTIETGEQYGIAVANNDPQKLLPVVNQAIKELKDTGEYDNLIAKWFGGGAQ